MDKWEKEEAMSRWTGKYYKDKNKFTASRIAKSIDHALQAREEMYHPKSNCCNAVVKIEIIREESGDPIREVFCAKCGKPCDFHGGTKDRVVRGN